LDFPDFPDFPGAGEAGGGSAATADFEDLRRVESGLTESALTESTLVDWPTFAAGALAALPASVFTDAFAERAFVPAVFTEVEVLLDAEDFLFVTDALLDTVLTFERARESGNAGAAG
jgi:hypothetical protein